MQELPDKYVFTIGEKLKTTKPGRHLEPIELVAYKQDTSVMELIRALSISLILSPKFGILVACVIRQFV